MCAHRIDESWIIKVADFGLTKSVYEKRYFRQDKDESVKLPIKWLAVESIDDCIFTEKTDVVNGSYNVFKHVKEMNLHGCMSVYLNRAAFYSV